MKRIALLLLVAACGGTYQAPPPVASIALPDGSQLKPYDPAQPGQARPQGLAQAAGRVYVTLTNQRDGNPNPVNAGPGFLAAFVPSTGAITLIDLGGSDGKQCQNPGSVRTSADGYLYANCSGNFSGTDAARAIVEVNPLSNTVTRRAVIPDGRIPNGVAAAARKIWTGDAMAISRPPTVFSIDRTTFTADATAPVPVDCQKSTYSYVADVMTIGGDVYALCGSDISGELYRLDPDTGAVKAHTTVGPIPTELAGLDDGRIVVVNAGDSTISLVTPSGGTLTAQTIVTLSHVDALQDVRAFGHILFTVASSTNTAQRIDLDAQGGPKVVAEANFGEGARPWNILPLDDTQAIVSNRGTNTIAAAKWVSAK